MIEQAEEINSVDSVNDLAEKLVLAYEDINLIYDIDDVERCQSPDFK